MYAFARVVTSQLRDPQNATALCRDHVRECVPRVQMHTTRENVYYHVRECVPRVRIHTTHANKSHVRVFPPCENTYHTSECIPRAQLVIAQQLISARTGCGLTTTLNFACCQATYEVIGSPEVRPVGLGGAIT